MIDNPISFGDLKSFFGSKPEFEDGTNIAFGTPFREELTNKLLPWYVPEKAKGTSIWKENFERLRTRFDKFIDDYCTSECFLVQTLIPQIGDPSFKPPGILPDRQLLWAGSGLRREPARLYGQQNQLSAQFSILNVRGEPFLEPGGKPLPFKLGLNRYISIHAIPDDLRPMPIPRLTELLGDGTNLLFQLPPEMAIQIWRNWLSGFSQKESKHLWVDALFEMAWQREKGSPMHIERYAWAENSSIGLSGTGLFPRLPKFVTDSPGEFCPHENCYPRASYSKITDIARASIAAIDEILEFASLPLQNQPVTKARKDVKAIKNQLFISYSHKDKKFLEDLLIHLKPIERSGQLTSWSDKQIEPGSKWFDEIQTALVQAKVAVLLVSANFLASNFIHEHELAPLLKKADKEGVRILWIPVRACAYKETPIQKYQAIISPDKPLAQMKAERDKAWVKICEEIQKAMAQSAVQI